MEGVIIEARLLLSVTWIKIDFQPQYACFQLLKNKVSLLYFELKNVSSSRKILKTIFMISEESRWEKFWFNEVVGKV